MTDMNLRSIIPASDQLDMLTDKNPELATLLAVYPEEEKKRLLENKEKLNKIAKAMDKAAITGTVNSMIMTCSTSCPFSSICVLRKNQLDPVGYPCPVEKKIVTELEYDIVQSLGIDRNDPIEMELLWDLIDTKLIDMRTSGYLKTGEVVQIIENKLGSVTTTRADLSPAIEIKLELKRLKHTIIDSFVATRRAKKKYGMDSDNNALQSVLLAAAKRIKDKKDEPVQQT